MTSRRRFTFAVGTLLVATMLMAPSAAPSVDANLLALYSFDAGTGSKVADLSGHGADGTAFGPTWGDGRFGSALSFDGVDDYVQAVGYFPFSATNAFTAEAWIRLSAHEAFDIVIAFRQCCHYRMLISPGRHPYYDAGTYADVEVGAFAFPLGEWHHYAMAVTGGSTAKIFIDGKKLSDVATGVPAHLPDIFDALFIGGGSEGQGAYFAGSIDELRLYDTALSDEQVVASMFLSSTHVLAADNARLLSRLQTAGLDATEFEGVVASQQRAARGGDALRAQDLAFEARHLAQQALAAHSAVADSNRTDLGRRLFVLLCGVTAFGVGVALLLIWQAWRRDRQPG